MKKKEETEVPEFQSLEEEREYWRARGPLTEGHKGRINRPEPGQKRSSFLAVRLTGGELTRLRDIAAKLGLGPSTFARLILTSAIEHQGKLPRQVTLDELRDALETNLSQPIKDKARALAKATATGDPGDPALLIVNASQEKALEDFTWSFLTAVFAMAGVQVIAPENKNYGEVRDIVNAQR